MTDKTLTLVERARNEAKLQNQGLMGLGSSILLRELADEIERLKSALRSMPEREKAVLMEKTVLQMTAQAAFIRLRCGKEQKELWDDAGEIVRMGQAALKARIPSDIDAALQGLRRK